MTLDQLIVFIKIVDEGSYRQAATLSAVNPL